MDNLSSESIKQPNKTPDKPTTWQSLKPALLLTLAIIACLFLFLFIYFRFLDSPTTGLFYGPVMSALFVMIVIPIAIIVWKKVR